MNPDALKLLASRVVNKIGNVFFDYGNNAWMAAQGALGKQFLGIYQITDLLTSILLNSFGGVLADRFERRRVLLWADGLCGLLCLLVALFATDRIMFWALVLVNIFLSIASSFTSPTYKALIPDVVGKTELLDYNANQEVIVKIISVCTPILSFIVLHFTNLRVTLLLDAVSFFLSFFFIFRIKVSSSHVQVEKAFHPKVILSDMWQGFVFIRQQREIFFLLSLAALVNFFEAGLYYLLPFTDHLFHLTGAYATLLSIGAVGSVIGALLSKKFSDSMQSLIWSLVGTGLGLMFLGFPVSNLVSFIGIFFFQFFESIFNIHFFSQVQRRVPKDYMGRVFSSIYTIALIFMPFGKFLMLILPHSLSTTSFIWLGLGIVLVGLGAYFYQKKLSNMLY